MKKNLFLFFSCIVSFSFCSPCSLLEDVIHYDCAAENAILKITSIEELKRNQEKWRKYYLDAIGGLPERTPLNARVVNSYQCDGFFLENIIFESQKGVYVTGHLAIPSKKEFKAPYPVILMPLGHSDKGILNPVYAEHLAMAARAGFATFTWDPISQGERRQAMSPKFDYKDNCSTEHTRLGFRAWLVGWNFARWRIWDAIRAVDYIETRDDCDISRLGIMGTSGGGTLSAYMQAIDPRIRVAFPNCYISSLREVFLLRGCHDAEQFFWNMLPSGFNHATIIAMGQPRVKFATGSRYRDYFPHKGAISTFNVFTNMTEKLGIKNPCWHFHCDGEHGLPPPTRQAQVDWMRHCLLNDPAPSPLWKYHSLGGIEKRNDPAKLPFPAEKTFVTPTHQVRDMEGFKSIYTIIADEATRLASLRKKHTREELREIVRRRAVIRPLSELGDKDESGLKLKFKWWYLEGREGKLAENEAAILATLGRTRVGMKAESILRKAAKKVAENNGKPIPLKASGADAIAAAHAYAAEPQLFSSLELTNIPPSWTEMVTNPNPNKDSFAIAVWGALKEYDWVDLIPEK